MSEGINYDLVIGFFGLENSGKSTLIQTLYDD